MLAQHSRRTLAAQPNLAAALAAPIQLKARPACLDTLLANNNSVHRLQKEVVAHDAQEEDEEEEEEEPQTPSLCGSEDSWGTDNTPPTPVTDDVPRQPESAKAEDMSSTLSLLDPATDQQIWARHLEGPKDTFEPAPAPPSSLCPIPVIVVTAPEEPQQDAPLVHCDEFNERFNPEHLFAPDIFFDNWCYEVAGVDEQADGEAREAQQPSPIHDLAHPACFHPMPQPIQQFGAAVQDFDDEDFDDEDELAMLGLYGSDQDILDAFDGPSDWGIQEY